MATQKIVLTGTPVRISDGTQRVFAESGEAVFRFAVSTSTPDKKVFHQASELRIHLGYSVWVWNPTNNPMTLVVTTSD